MQINKRYLQKYLYDIAIDQIAEEYKVKGYLVSKEEKVGNYYADIIARTPNETIIIEVKTGKMTSEKKDAIKEIGNYVRNKQGYKFLVVIATPPKEKKLEIENIEDILFRYFTNHLPDELDQLSSHTRVDEVSDVNIDEMAIGEGGTISVRGNGIVAVELQIGSDSDKVDDLGHVSGDNFSFEFDLVLALDKTQKYKISNVNKIEVDTHSYYE